jgi:hypothetical protein
VSQRSHGKPRQLPAAALIIGAVLVGMAGVAAIVKFVPTTPDAPQTPPPVVVETPHPEPSLAAPTVAEQVTALLTNAEAELDAKNPQGALQAIDDVLKLQPENADALKLKTKIESATTPTTPPTIAKKPPVLSPAQQPWPANLPVVSPRPGESQEAREARAQLLYDRYNTAMSKLRNGEVTAAAQDFERILQEVPNYSDATSRLIEARQKEIDQRRNVALVHWDKARAFETSADLVGARREYQAALDADPSIPNVQDALTALGRKMAEEGVSAFRRANVFINTRGKERDAREQYQKAIDYLPADDPSRKLAQERLQQLERQLPKDR